MRGEGARIRQRPNAGKTQFLAVIVYKITRLLYNTSLELAYYMLLDPLINVGW